MPHCFVCKGCKMREQIVRQNDQLTCRSLTKWNSAPTRVSQEGPFWSKHDNKPFQAKDCSGGFGRRSMLTSTPSWRLKRQRAKRAALRLARKPSRNVSSIGPHFGYPEKLSSGTCATCVHLSATSRTTPVGTYRTIDEQNWGLAQSESADVLR